MKGILDLGTRFM